MAQQHLTAWRQLGVTTGLYSTGRNAAGLADGAGAILHAELASLIDGSDVVDICTPSTSHLAVGTATAAAGKPVICEKPLARSHSQAVELIGVCRQAAVPLLVGHVVRYFPQYAAAKEAVAAGRIGRPTELRLSRAVAMPTRSWYADESLSGGVLLDLMIHDIDYARWIAGDVTWVEAAVTTGERGEVIGNATLQHRDGAVSRLTGLWGVAGQPFSAGFELTGTAGVVRSDDFAADALVTLPAGDGYDADLQPYIAQLAEFAAVINGSATARVTAQDALAALDIALAAIESSRSGRPVALV
ncbi:MAG: Gfo/Idh/MocA family oxidoreductase [Actinomycetota bacterium]|nr:Gfo/Idh/MocA family oxidoreductase [Actinomycetota bacterium]